MTTRKDRIRLIRIYGTLYSRLENVELDKCWYCDSKREALDHCPALKQLDYIDVDSFVKNGGKLCLIPSCAECNSLIGDKPLQTPAVRLAYLYEAYSKKVDKFYTDWTPEEIEELGPTLRREVLAKQRVVNEWIDKYRNIETNIINLEKNYPNLT